jgi:RNA polymerase sigma-70 factor (ECF subfamily)
VIATARATNGRRGGGASPWHWARRLLALAHDERDIFNLSDTDDADDAARLDYRRIERNEPDRFEAFFREHEGRVFGYLLRMTGDEHAAHDLSQETFVRAWRHFARIAAYESPLGWLLRVATNLALTARRRGGLPGASPGALPDGDDEPAFTDPAQRIVEVDAVQRVLLDLAPRQRAALVLREVYGLNCDEVGRALGVSRDAAKMLLLRARQQFRARYEGDQKPEGGAR